MTTESFSVNASSVLATRMAPDRHALATAGYARPSRKYGSQAFFWTPDWQASEQRATVELLLGEVRPVTGAAQMIRTLRRSAARR